jgi:hypothetical protein
MLRHCIYSLLILAQTLLANPPALMNPCPAATGPLVDRPETAARVLNRVPPVFPQRAHDLKINLHSVLLEFIVPVDNAICDIRIVNPGTFGFDENAVDALSTWTFAPAIHSGRAVPSRLQVEVKFNRLEFKPLGIREIRKEASFNALTPKLVNGSEPERRRAMQALKEMSDEAYPPADALYGMALLEGKGVAQNPEQGLKRIQRAREKRSPLGDFAYGHALEFGFGVPPDRPKAFEHYRRAAEAPVSPVPAAQLRLAAAHLSGDTVNQDRSAATQLFRKCAAAGVKACAFNLAQSLSQPGATEADRTEALAWALILEDAQHPRSDELLKTLDGPLRPTATALKPQLFPQRYKP